MTNLNLQVRMSWLKEVTMPGVLLRFPLFGGVSKRGKVRARGLVLDQEGLEEDRLFQWHVRIF